MKDNLNQIKNPKQNTKVVFQNLNEAFDHLIKPRKGRCSVFDRGFAAGTSKQSQATASNEWVLFHSDKAGKCWIARGSISERIDLLPKEVAAFFVPANTRLSFGAITPVRIVRIKS